MCSRDGVIVLVYFLSTRTRVLKNYMTYLNWILLLIWSLRFEMLLLYNLYLIMCIWHIKWDIWNSEMHHICIWFRNHKLNYLSPILLWVHNCNWYCIRCVCVCMHAWCDILLQYFCKFNIFLLILRWQSWTTTKLTLIITLVCYLLQYHYDTSSL